jgi:ABC-type glycerol-3-phosphate transport system permease component
MPEPNNLDRWAREVVEQSKGSIRRGLGLTLALHLLCQVITALIVSALSIEGNYLWVLPLVFMGLSQLVYMIPAILIFRRRGATETAKGLIVGASITFLLNATCNGFRFFG